MMIKLPEKYKERMKVQLGESFDDYLAAMEKPPVRGLRTNTLKISPGRLCSLVPKAWGLQASTLCREGFIIGADGEKEAGKHPYHAAGAYYIQEPSAMSVCSELYGYDFTDDTRVLDMCAAPGGKSGAVAALMQGKGLLVSNEIVAERAQELAKNIERLGITNAVVTNASPKIIEEKFPTYFDIVIVDAPCSGEGMFRKNPSACDEWSPEHVNSCANRQYLILQSAAKCLKAGGILLYSTCTFSEAENEDVTGRFATEYGFTIQKQRRLFPHTCEGEGHFVCVMTKEKSDSIPPKKGKEKQQKSAYQPCKSRTFSDFINETYKQAPKAKAFIADGGKVILCTDEMLSIAQKLPCISCGVHAGFDKGNYFAPSHTLFLAAYDCEYRLQADFPPCSPELLKYMSGEEIQSPFPHGTKGYCLVCTDNLPVGFGKVTDGMIKNKLPKGLRRF